MSPAKCKWIGRWRFVLSQLVASTEQLPQFTRDAWGCESRGLGSTWPFLWATRWEQEGLRAAGLHVMTTNGTLLYEPHTVQIDMRQWRGHFGTLTPFTSACQQAERVAPLGEPLPATVPQAAAAKVVQACAGVPLDALGLRLMPLDANGHPIDWAQGITNGWRFGEHAALELLEALLARTPEHYEKNRHLVRRMHHHATRFH
jgi:deoxyribodipyrimidine photolyase